MQRAGRRTGLGVLLLLLPGSCLTPSLPDLAVAAAPPAAATPATVDGPSADNFILPRAARQGLAMVAVAPQGAVQVTIGGAIVPVTADGRFLLALDRDAPDRIVLRAERDGAEAVEATLAVEQGRWRIEHIDAPWRGSASSDADFARRRAAELDEINAARRVESTSDGWRQNFIWPVRGRLSGWFGSQRVYQGKPGSYHSGLDIAAPMGTPFVAPADGVVVLAAARPFTLEGNLLIVDHGMGLSSAFLHAARLDVVTGQQVRQGEPLGAVGATGRATGPHLHWGLRWRSARLDPLPLLP